MSERISSPKDLHDEFRKRFGDLNADLANEGIALGTYETVRTPFRQAALYAQGRTAPGPRVTKAQPFESAHQYGLAADMVFWLPPGRWSWAEPTKGLWSRYGVLASKHGLEQLSFEQPHVQLPSWRKIAADRTRWTQWSRDQWDLWTAGR